MNSTKQRLKQDSEAILSPLALQGVRSAPRIGDLRTEECLDAELRRCVRTARLFNIDSAIYSDKLPELLDVRLMAMSPKAFTLTGFERIAVVEYAQSWLVSNFGRAESG